MELFLLAITQIITGIALIVLSGIYYQIKAELDTAEKAAEAKPEAEAEKQPEPGPNIVSRTIVGKSEEIVGSYKGDSIAKYVILNTSEVFEYDGMFNKQMLKNVAADEKFIIYDDLRYKYHSSPTKLTDVTALGIIFFKAE